MWWQGLSPIRLNGNLISLFRDIETKGGPLT